MKRSRPTASDSKGSRGASTSSRGASDDELAALEALVKEGTWHVGGADGQDLKLTNLDKPLFGPATDDPEDS